MQALIAPSLEPDDSVNYVDPVNTSKIAAHLCGGYTAISPLRGVRKLSNTVWVRSDWNWEKEEKDSLLGMRNALFVVQQGTGVMIVQSSHVAS